MQGRLKGTKAGNRGLYLMGWEAMRQDTCSCLPLLKYELKELVNFELKSECHFTF
ncbi:hypothetical protein Dimus_012772, partial [Dionaea muscipula]